MRCWHSLVRALVLIILVLGVKEEALLLQSVLVALDVFDVDDGEAHLPRPRVHHLANVVLVVHHLVIDQMSVGLG